jgi:metal-responsive CopG/Arc/MetJ family transcriptional regulator
MKTKTSITLSEDVLRAIARATKEGESRSEVIERLLRESFQEQTRRANDKRDQELINKHVEQLNEETEDVLSYQVEF